MEALAKRVGAVVSRDLGELEAAAAADPHHSLALFDERKCSADRQGGASSQPHSLGSSSIGEVAASVKRLSVAVAERKWLISCVVNQLVLALDSPLIR